VNGARIGITAARRAAEQAALVRNLGGEPVVGPVLRPDPPHPDEVVGPGVERLLSEPVDVIVFLTGVGARLIFEHAARAGREDDLRRRIAGARIVARGTKPRRALRALGIELDEVIDPPVTAAVRDRLLREPLAGRRVFVQGFGPDPTELTDPLAAAGAAVWSMSPYGAALPDDTEPAAALAREAAAGTLAAITFTSALAARQFAAIADHAGIDPGAVRASATLVVAVGPVTREALAAEGLPPDVEPETPRMGAMYQSLAAALRGRPSRGGG
jgi:uroporphyrinogen-III synthase